MNAHCQYPLFSEQNPEIICSLEQYQLIEISGEDSATFLQGQLTTDVSKLAIGHNTLSAHCDPKGKVWSIFRVLRLAQNHFYLIIRKSLLPIALDQLKKYAVFSKVSFNLLENRTLLGLSGIGLSGAQIANSLNLTLPNAENPLHDKNGNLLIYIESAQPRWLMITELRIAEQTPQIGSNQPHLVWDLLDIQDGIPLLSAESQNQFIPQAINLQLLEQTVSFHKGCYIGQETIARAKYRGANRRALFTLVGQFSSNEQNAVPQIGQAIELLLETNWRKTGFILSAVQHQGILWLQVVLANDTEPSQRFRLSEKNPQPFCLYPLPYTLEQVE